MTQPLQQTTHRAALVTLVGLSLSIASAQTPITPDRNKYTPAQDVQLGQEAASEAKRQLPMLNDRRVEDFVEQVGDDLVGAIPAELRQPAFRYSFDVVNQKEINAFALPGGPMFVHRGMLEAAKSEGEVAGVMAHEIAHVALRHGTAQATKGEKFQIGAVAGQILGAIVGGRTGSVIAQGSQFGLGAYFMKYGREYEREADLLGAQIMARAGYDPHEMANMFKTIEAQGGGGGPEWLSDHPNPGNRYNAITKEASMLRVQGTANTGDFPSIRARLRGMAPAYTAEQIARRQDRRESGGPVGTSGRTIAPPSGQYRTYQAGNFLRISVPANWRQVAGGNTLTYAPDGAYVTSNGGTAFTHGLEVGVTQGTGNLQRDTQQIVQGFVRANPGLRVAGNARREGIGGRQGLTLPLSNVSDLTGDQEYISLATTQLADGSVLFLIGVAPQPEARTYDTAFRRVRETIQIADR